MKTTNRSKSKIPLLELIKTTFIGGFVVVIPVYLVILIIKQIIQAIIVFIPTFLDPITFLLDIHEKNIATLVALIIFLIICFIAGIIVKSNHYVLFKNTFEPLFKKIPGYLLIRRITKHMVKIEQTDNHDVAFVAIEETDRALVPAFLIEKHSNGYYTVFVPSVPTLTVGNVYIIPGNRVFPVSVPFVDMITFISQWGEASPKLLEIIQKIQV